MEPAADEIPLRRYLLQLPEVYRFKHEQIRDMRRDLRLTLLRELCGDFAPMLFGHEGVEARAFLPPREWLPQPDVAPHSHHGRPCAMKLGRGEPTHRCLTCGLDDTCVLCKHCYNPADHEGHNVFVKISSRDDGGICDCGDHEAWTREIHCLTECDQAPPAALPPAFVARAARTLGVALDFVVDVLSGASLTAQHVVNEEQIERISAAARLRPGAYASDDDLPAGVRWCLLLWDNATQSPIDLRNDLQLATERSDDFIRMVINQVSKTGRATIAVSPELLDLFVVRSKIRHFTTSIRSIRDVMREEMASEILRVALDLTKCRVDQADPYALTRLVGEALLSDWRPGIEERDPSIAVEVAPRSKAEVWALSDLVGLRIPSEADRDMISAMADLMSAGDNDSESDSSTAFTPLNRGLLALARATAAGPTTTAATAATTAAGATAGATAIVNTASVEETLPGADIDDVSAGKLYERLAQELGSNLKADVKLNWPLGTRPSRVKYLIFFDIRLYRVLRQTLTDLYVAALMSDPELKIDLANVYADLYPLLMEQYMNIDQEQDLSVTTVLSTQLFTTPSVATSLMQTDAFFVYCKMLRSLFMRHGKLDPSIFRNRKIGTVFNELGYLFWRNTNKALVGSNTMRLIETANFLSLFQGLAPMQRRTDKHVEYENDRWVYCFASVPFALQLARAIASCVQDSPEPPVEAIRTIVAALNKWELSLRAELGVLDGSGKPRRLLPEQDYVSMLNTVHAFLSWLIEFSNFRDLASIRYVLRIDDSSPSFNAQGSVVDADMGTDGDVVDEEMASNSKDSKLVDESSRPAAFSMGLFDAPMRTLALLSQISVGLWVRNGYAMRIQLQCYREVALRDLAYACDIFLTQVAFTVLDPDVVFTNLMQRFEVENWPEETLGDEHQRVYLLEEFIHCCTSLLSDRLRLQGLRGNDLKRAILAREILQVLGFGSMPYSEITKLVPDSLVGDEFFDMILSECADFTPPRGARGIGMYNLKPELFEQFDPQYTYFTLARAEEAERVVQRKTGNNIQTAPLLPLKGHWNRLGLFTLSQSFAAFVLNVLTRAPQLETAQAESVLGRLLHLLIVAAKDDMSRVDREQAEEAQYSSIAQLLMTDGIDGGGSSIADALFRIYNQPELRAVHSRIKHLFEVVHAIDDSVPLIAPSESETDLEAAEQTRRKQKGKAMQEKVLADFHRQQEEFMQKNSGCDGEQYDEDSEMETGSGEYVFPKQCVLCRMPDDAVSIFGIMTYTSETQISRDIPVDDPYWVQQAYSEDPTLDVEHPLSTPARDEPDNPIWGPAFPSAHTHTATVVQGCGHGVHYRCYTQFLEQQQLQRPPLKFSPVVLSKREYLCPLCRGLNNGFMPVLWTTNDLDVETFLGEAEDSLGNMKRALEDTSPPPVENIRGVVESGLSTLSEKFWYAIEHQDFSEPLAGNVRLVLLEQMLKIKEAFMDGSDEVYGLRTIYRSLSSTVAQTEIELRGQKHSTPFGGLVIDQLPPRKTQFLRVFAKYVSTLTGFIMSSSIQLGSEPVRLRLVPIVAENAFCRMVELFVFGSPVYGIEPITSLRAGLASGFIRTFLSVDKLNMAELPTKDLPAIDPELAGEISKWTNRDPRVVYSVLRYQSTVLLRRAAILVFAMCGRYDSDDYAGMMHLPEHDRLLSYLQLPPLETFVKNLGKETPEGLAARRFAMECYANTQLRTHLEYPGVYRLLKLPRRLDAMFQLAGTGMPTDPALCLFCGYVAWIQKIDDDKPIGPCSEHLSQCVASEGIFLVPGRNAVLLLLPDGRGTFIPAPYLDLHGELDEQMRRGRPHYLQPLRYDTMAREIWLQNGLPSTIARRLDQNQDLGGWETL